MGPLIFLSPDEFPQVVPELVGHCGGSFTVDDSYHCFHAQLLAQPRPPDGLPHLLCPTHLSSLPRIQISPPLYGASNLALSVKSQHEGNGSSQHIHGHRNVYILDIDLLRRVRPADSIR